MFKRILVGIDGSKESLRALNLAINLAKLHGAY
ncbi:universal stress protein [Acidianus sp.]